MTAQSEAATLPELAGVTDAIRDAVESVIQGKRDVVDTALTVLLAGGHLLIEDVPGVGKTMLAKALSQAIDSTMSRVQFTSDLMPSDLTGVSVFNPQTRDFDFRPGAIFANVVVGDEINRASPKTQAALLECMAENQVTVDGTTYPLARPFMVIATQNPVEMEGTYPLPEAQRDRFMARIRVGYPSVTDELAMLDRREGHDPLDDLSPVTDAKTVLALQQAVRGVYAAPALKHYLVDLVAATRAHPAVRLGASPRATLALLRASQARAALAGRRHTVPDDVQAVASVVLGHRLMLTVDAQLSRLSPDTVLSQVLGRVPIPTRADG